MVLLTANHCDDVIESFSGLVLIAEESGSQQWESLPEENRVGLIRCEESPRTQCPSLSSGCRKKRGTFRALEARVEWEEI